VSLFAVLDPLVEYCAQVKPYAVDALATVLLLRLCLPQARVRPVIAALLGALLVWCSYPAILVAAAVAASRIAMTWRAHDRAETLRWLGIGGVWAGSFAVQYLLCTRAAAGNSYLADFWVTGFVPMTSVPDALAWLGRTALGVFQDPLGLSVPWVALPLAVLGVLALLRGARPLGIAMVALLACCVLAATLRLYPFATSWTPQIGWCTGLPLDRPILGRLSVFTVPALLCAIAAGVAVIARVAPRVLRVAATLAIAVLLLCGPLHTAWTYRARAPELQELGALFDAFVRDRRPDDQVFFFNSALQVEYLQRRHGIAIEGVEVPPVLMARSMRGFVERMPTGVRFWVLVVSQPGMDWVAAMDGLIELGQHMVRCVSRSAAPGAAVFLCERL